MWQVSSRLDLSEVKPEDPWSPQDGDRTVTPLASNRGGVSLGPARAPREQRPLGSLSAWGTTFNRVSRVTLASETRIEGPQLRAGS